MAQPAVETSNRSREQAVDIPPLPGQLEEPWSWRKLGRMLKSFGPAAILASMSIGAGETIVVVRTGAWARYDLLWVVLLSCLAKAVFITYLLGRYTAVSGESVGQRLVRLPGPRGWFLLLIVAAEVLFAPLAWVAIAKPCGSLAHHFISSDTLRPLAGGGFGSVFYENLYTTIIILAALVVGLTHTYKRLEREQLIFCGILVAGTLAGTAMVWPDLWAAATGTLLRIGRLPESMPPWAPEEARKFPFLHLATVFAYVGGSVSGYIAYAHWVSIRGWGLTGHPDIGRIRALASHRSRIDYLPDDPEQRRRLRLLASPLRWDIALGALVLFLISASFMVAGAATLYERQSCFSGWNLLTDQASIWRNIHPWLVPVYYITVLAALWGTLTALLDVYACVTFEFFSAIWPRRRWNYGAIRWLIAGSIFAEAAIFIWADVGFDVVTELAGFFVSNLAVAALAVAAIHLNFQLPPAYRASRWVLLGAIASALILLAAASLSTHELVKKWFGS